MNFRFVSMNAAYAQRIVAEWRYEGQYAIYDYDHEAEHMLDEEEWGDGLFAVLDGTGELVGELSFWFLDEAKDDWVPRADAVAGRLEGSILWIGFGLRPDLTGKGLGLPFVNACTDFAVKFARERYGYAGEYVGLGVAKSNQRAVKVYARAGFEPYWEGPGAINDQPIDAIHMRMKLQRSAAAT